MMTAKTNWVGMMTVKTNFFLGRFSRGQLFTADLLVAVSVIILVLGISLHVSEALSRGVFKQAELSAAAPEAIAEGLVASQPFHLNLSRYCFLYSNGTGNCSGISCPSGNVLASRRLVNCTDSSNDNNCVLEVRTCAGKD